MRYIDLHTHSTASDGAVTPAGLVDEARALGLSAIALTDHDTVGGMAEFMARGAEFDDVETIPGVEVSVDLFGREAHIVGLFIDYEYAPLLELLAEIRGNRDLRNQKIVDKLRAAGYNITMAEVLDIAGGDSVGRPHFARILVDKGYFPESQAVFDRCLKRGQVGFAPRVLPEPARAVGLIHDAGGLAIWAHAAHRRKNDRSHVKKTLTRLLEHDIDGVETLYTTFSEEQTAMMREFAAEHDLLESGGSDYHGANQQKVALGTGFGDLRVPETLLHPLRQAWLRRNPSDKKG